MADIPDDQAQALVNAAKLLQMLQGNKNALPHLERAIKAINPDLETSEEVSARMAEPVIAPLKAQVEELTTTLQSRIEADDKRRADAEQALQERNIAEAFQRLQDRDGYQPEGIERIKALMVERNIADPEAAAALFDRMNPPAKAEQAAWEPARWNIEQNAVETDTQGLFANPDKWADDMVGQVLMEERRKTQDN